MEAKLKQPIRPRTRTQIVDNGVDVDLKAEEPASPPVPLGLKVKKRAVGAAISGIERLLTQQDLESDGAKKIFLAQYDEIIEENEELQSFRDWYYEAEMERAVLREQLTAAREGIAKDGFMLALSGVLITLGLALPSLFTTSQTVVQHGVSVVENQPAPGVWTVMVVLIVCGALCLTFPVSRALRSGAK